MANPTTSDSQTSADGKAWRRLFLGLVVLVVLVGVWIVVMAIVARPARIALREIDHVTGHLRLQDELTGLLQDPPRNEWEFAAWQARLADLSQRLSRSGNGLELSAPGNESVPADIEGLAQGMSVIADNPFRPSSYTDVTAAVGGLKQTHERVSKGLINEVAFRQAQVSRRVEWIRNLGITYGVGTFAAIVAIFATTLRPLARGIQVRMRSLRVANAELDRVAFERDVLAEAGRTANSSLTFDKIFEEYARQVNFLVPFDRLAIMTVDMERRTAVNRFVAGTSIPGVPVGSEVPLDGTLAKAAISSGAGICADFSEGRAADTLALMPKMAMAVASGITSATGVPLSYEDRVIGVLVLMSRTAGAYGARHVDLVRQFALVLAPALHNSLLYEASQRKTAETQLLNEIGQVIASSLEIRTVYDAFASKVRKLVPWDRIVSRP